MSESVVPHDGLRRAVEGLDRLHPDAVRDGAGILAILERVQRDQIPLRRGMNRRIAPELAQIERFEPDALILRTRNFERGAVDVVFLNFELDGQPYFFSAPFEASLANGCIRTRLPDAIYQAERRDRVRRPPENGDPQRVALGGPNGRGTEAVVTDTSPDGLAVCVTEEIATNLEGSVRIRFLDGPNAGIEKEGAIRHREPMPLRNGWTRIGLDLSPIRTTPPLHIEHRARVLETTATQRAQRRWRVFSAAARVATDRAFSTLGRRTTLPAVRIVDYANEHGENIRAVVDSWGDTRGAAAVVIPPAWGRTKETLMPLAATLVAGFRAAGEPIVVIRFDGIRKRGESHNDPGCRTPGSEHHRFTFSQGARDIRTTLDFLERSPEFRPRKTILVSFSAASIESRRAVATDPRIDGWVCVVGAADTQSMMRVISGGVDYGVGLERGVRFGLQEILGVEVDMDLAGLDAIETGLAYLHDARNDMERVRVPVTWFHGKHDAWMDFNRAQDILSHGDTTQRKLIEVPTGHMLRTSREALETFQLVTSEAGRMLLGREIVAPIPDLLTLERRHGAERARLQHATEPDLRSFWKDYLLGRDETVGIELMTSITPYRELMAEQIAKLDLRGGEIVADLGSGTGAFPIALASLSVARDVSIVEIDFVRQGLQRLRSRLAPAATAPGFSIAMIEANLDIRRGTSRSIPLSEGSCDAALASLLLSYVSRPDLFLREVHRLLRPGGRLVLSALRRDADMSKLFTEGLDELRIAETRARSGRADLDQAARGYLNQASRLLDLEETGVFHFWDAPELVALLTEAGFSVEATSSSFGQPPQAVVVSARRP